MTTVNNKSNLHWQILVALLLAVIVGLNLQKDTEVSLFIFSVNFYETFEFLGKIFLNGLRMLSIPLILTSIISGMASIGSEKAIGKMGITTLAYYLITSTIAILVGLILINIIQPGYDPHLQEGHTEAMRQQLTATFKHAQDNDVNFLFNIFYQLIPSNIFFSHPMSN